jgi:hypothetical protein
MYTLPPSVMGLAFCDVVKLVRQALRVLDGAGRAAAGSHLRRRRHQKVLI